IRCLPLPSQELEQVLLVFRGLDPAGRYQADADANPHESACDMRHISNAAPGVKHSTSQVTNEVKENDPDCGDIENSPPEDAPPVKDPDLITRKEHQKDAHETHDSARGADHGSRIAD